MTTNDPLHSLDLTKIKTWVKTRKGDRRRQFYMSKLFSYHGMSFDFVPCDQGPNHVTGCSLAYQTMLDRIHQLPALALDDDVAFFKPPELLPPLPSDADIVYLGITGVGCLPRLRSHVRRLGHVGLSGFALTSPYNDDWLRVHSMVSAYAILYLTERGVNAHRAAAKAAVRRNSPIDVFFAYVMNGLRVYTPKTPVFYEYGAIQKSPVRGRWGEFWTKCQLTPMASGHVRYGVNQPKWVRACVEQSGDALHWHLLESGKAPRRQKLLPTEPGGGPATDPNIWAEFYQKLAP